MTEEIKLSKFDNEPWGFRLTGGKDFGTVLTVIKINQGSLAETAGMRIGDLLLAINDQPLTNLSHSEAHDVIIHAGNNIVFTIVRGSQVKPPPLLVKDRPSIETNNNKNEQILTYEGETDSVTGEVECIVHEKFKNTSHSEGKNLSAPVSPVPALEQILEEEKKCDEILHPNSEEELEDIMLGHAEVINGKAIGVDFYKMAPKCEIIEKSAVIRALEEEKVTEAKKTLSKFLQQPNHPKVKPKQCDIPAVMPYKPKIVIPKKGQPESTEQSKLNLQSFENSNEEDKIIQEKHGDQEGECGQNKSHELKDHIKDEEKETTNQQEQEEANKQPKDTNPEEELSTKENNILKEMAVINTSLLDWSNNNEIHGNDSSNKCSPEFEKQLKQINEQLANLLCMPLDMQKYLEQIKKQIEELRQLQYPPPAESETRQPEQRLEEESKHVIEEESKHVIEQEADQEMQQKFKQDLEPQPSQPDKFTSLPDEESQGEQDYQVTVLEQEIAGEVSEEYDKQAPETEPSSESAEEGHPKHPKQDIKWQKEPVPKNRPFFPLTPKPRPVVLPQDNSIFHDNELFSEEFIAETLSGSAEVLQGKTIGVNFMKFKKSYDHLQSSDVYRLIQNEEKNRSIFPSRSGKIPSKEDCLQSVSGRDAMH